MGLMGALAKKSLWLLDQFGRLRAASEAKALLLNLGLSTVVTGFVMSSWHWWVRQQAAVQWFIGVGLVLVLTGLLNRFWVAMTPPKEQVPVPPPGGTTTRTPTAPARRWYLGYGKEGMVKSVEILKTIQLRRATARMPDPKDREITDLLHRTIEQAEIYLRGIERSVTRLMSADDLADFVDVYACVVGVWRKYETPDRAMTRDIEQWREQHDALAREFRNLAASEPTLGSLIAGHADMTVARRLERLSAREV